MLMCKGRLDFVWKIRATFFLSTVSASATVHSSRPFITTQSIYDINMLSTEICVVDSYIYTAALTTSIAALFVSIKNFLLRGLVLVH